MKKRELELAQPGALESAKAEDPLLKEAIGQYVKDSKRKLGRTKEQVLRTIHEAPIGSMRCSEVGSPEIVQFAQSLDVLPQTAGNYISHLATVFTIARAASGYPLNQQAMSDARKAMKRLGTTSKSAQRDRRPTLDALDKILKYYVEMETRERAEIPTPGTIAFALFSTLRQEQITTIAREDYQQDRVMVRDMKHPGQKSGNDTWCDLPLEAARVLDSMPGKTGAFFPHNHRSISASFTKACKFLETEDLHFHDLRHEGTSRLFEMGWNIPHVTAVTGHRSWTSLKRYTHLRQNGDKWAGWRWLDMIAPPAGLTDESVAVST